MQRKRIRKATTKSATKTKTATRSRKSSTQKRTSVTPRGDARYVRRDEGGRFDEVVDVGRSQTRDRRTRAKTVVPSGMGDRGDQKRRTRSTKRSAR